MRITVMKSKLHHATVTQANVDYEGSITIDEALMQEARIFPGERVQIVNKNNGERLETYVIRGTTGSGIIGLNGPAALKCSPGHVIHIISYAILDETELTGFHERVLILGENNTIKQHL